MTIEFLGSYCKAGGWTVLLKTQGTSLRKTFCVGALFSRKRYMFNHWLLFVAGCPRTRMHAFGDWGVEVGMAPSSSPPGEFFASCPTTWDSAKLEVPIPGACGQEGRRRGDPTLLLAFLPLPLKLHLLRDHLGLLTLAGSRPLIMVRS